MDSTRCGYPVRAAPSMARPICSVVVTEPGATRISSGTSGAAAAYSSRYQVVRDVAPWRGAMKPGRKAYPLGKVSSTAFSVRPFTRAHMRRPRSVESVPAPDTYTKTMSGLTCARVRAAATVKSWVIRV